MGNLLLMGVDMSGFCGQAAEILQFVGWVLTIFKIAIPLIIIFLGAFDLGKAVVASKDDEIKKSAKALGMRALAGVCIFFVPTIVMWLFGAINAYNEANDNGSIDSDVCQTCILKPWQCNTGK